MLDVELGPGATRTLTFAEAALDTIPAAFDLARKTAARSWQAELARIEMLDASQVLDIRTGDPEWDAALAFSQKAAHAVFFSGSEHLPNPSFVNARYIDHGYSRKGDGTGTAGWNGQFPWKAYTISSIWLARRKSQNLLLNFHRHTG